MIHKRCIRHAARSTRTITARFYLNPMRHITALLLLITLLGSLLPSAGSVSTFAAPQIMPQTLVIAPGDRAVFSVAGASVTGWEALGGGSISPLGIFSAPPISATVTLRATTTAGPTEATVLVRSWAPLADTPLPAVGINTLAYGPDGTLYAGTEDYGVYALDPHVGGFWRAMRGRDGGLSNAGMRVRAMVFDAAGTHYLATNGGVFMRPAGRTFWALLSAGLPEQSSTEGAHALLVLDDELYAGFTRGAVRRWDRAAQRWELVGAAQPSERPIYTLASDGSQLFAGSADYAYVLPTPRDPGGAWQALGASFGEQVLHLGVFNGQVYAGVRNRGLFGFDGSAWIQSNRFGGVGFAVANGQLFAGGSSLNRMHVMRLSETGWVNATPDNGDVPGNPGVRAFAIAPDGTIAIARQGAVFRSARGLAAPAPSGTVADVSVATDALTLRVGTNAALQAAVVPGAVALPNAANRIFLPLLSSQQGAPAPTYAPDGGLFWISSDAAIASVDARGIVTAHAPGQVTITAVAMADPSKTRSLQLTVIDPAPTVQQITLRAQPSAIVEVERSIMLYADLDGRDLGDMAGVTWESANPALATVSAAGQVTGVAPGTTTIMAFAQANPQVSASITITVVPSSVAALPTAGRWVNISAGLPANPRQPDEALRVIALTPHAGRIFAGTEGQEVWAYANTSWTRIAAAGSLGAYMPAISSFAHTADGTLYALTSRRMVFRYRADNDWLAVTTGLPDANLLRLFTADGALHVIAEAGSASQIYRLSATDQWESFGQPLTAPRPLAGPVATTRGIMVGSGDGNVYQLATDGSWQNASAGLPQVRSESNPGGIDPRDVGIVQLTAASDGSLYAISDGARNKLFRLTPTASAWEPIVRYEYKQGASASAAWIGDGWYLGGDERVVRFSGTTRITLGAAYASSPELRVRAIASPDDGRTIVAAGQSPTAGSSVWMITPDPLAPVRDSNLAVDSATYLGNSPDADEAMAVEIAPDGSVVIAGSSEDPGDYGVVPTLLLGGGSGVITRLDPTGQQVRSRTRIAQRIVDMEIAQPSGRIAIASDRGVSVLSASADRVIWHAELADGVDRVAISSAGHVAALMGNTVISYSPDGAEVARTPINKSFVTDVAIDAATGSIFVTGFHNQTLPSGLPVQSAYLYAFSDALEFKWKNWDWPGAQLTGNEADTRGYRVAMGRDGMLYFLGENAGGNTVFRWQPRYLSASGNLISYDDYSSGVFSASAHFAYFARLNPVDGSVLAGQFAVPRLSSGLSNTFRVRAISADEQGTVYVGGQAASAIESRDTNRIAGQLIAPYAGGDGVVLVVSPDFSTRLVWTTWAGGGPNHNTMVNGVAAGQGVAAMAATAGGGRLLVHQPLPNAGAPSATLAPHNPDGFIATWSIRVGR